jgi:WD40 repeat protein
MTASGDYTAAVWDIADIRLSYRLLGHEASVKTVKNSPVWRDVFITAGRDGGILVYDLRAGGAIGQDGLPICHPVAKTFCVRGGRGTNVTSLECIAGGNILACTLSNSPEVCFYDIRKVAGPSVSSTSKPATFIAAVNPEAGHSDEFDQSYIGNSWLTVSPDGSSLAVCSLGGCIYLYSSLTALHSPVIFKDIPTSYFTKPCFSPDGQFIACGSLNSCVYIWDIFKPRQSCRLHAHTREVNSVRWSTGGCLFLTTCGDDDVILVWDFDLSNLA